MSQTMTKLLLSVILANLFIFSSGQNSSAPKYECPDALKRFTEADLIVSARTLENYVNSNSCDNVVLSPLGILFNLMGIALFAEGPTKTETYATLKLNSREEITCVANTVNSEVGNLPDCVEFAAATNLYANIQYQFTPDFKSNWSQIIIGRTDNLNFSDAGSVNKINSDVASQTDNRIPDVIQDSSLIDFSTEIVSITALFFSATWQIEMQSTEEVTEFRVSPTESVPQTFLYQDAVYLYAHSDILEAQVVQINFCCETFYMWEILPDCPFTEDVLIKKMAENTDWYYELLEKLKPTRLDLYFPKANRSSTVDSKAVFGGATGLKTIYDDQAIDLKGAIVGNCPAAVTTGVQTTYVKTGFEGGPVPEGSQSEETKKTLKIDYPHAWIIFRYGRVHLIGASRTSN